jgi:hypothetical protein
MIRDAWKSVGKVFVIALIIDVADQLYVERFVYPGEAVIVAVMLAIIPYLILRGLVTRIARRDSAASRTIRRSSTGQKPK